MAVQMFPMWQSLHPLSDFVSGVSPFGKFRRRSLSLLLVLLADLAARVGSQTVTTSAGPKPGEAELPRETTLQQYADDMCTSPIRMQASQQLWVPVVGFQYCFRIMASELCTFPPCSVRVFCARAKGGSGTALKFYSGPNCYGEPTSVAPFQNQISWAQLKLMVYNESCVKQPATAYGVQKWAKFTVPWAPDTFPNCLGYDGADTDAALLTLTMDPKDFPYKVSFYNDSNCEKLSDSRRRSLLRRLLSMENEPTYANQTWTSVFRKLDASQRHAAHVHCWMITRGYPELENKSFKLSCKMLIDGRSGLQLQLYKGGSCEGELYSSSKEPFFNSLGYRDLFNGKSDVEKLKDFFQGSCEPFSFEKKIWWKFDRPVWYEDWPDCYAKALQDGTIVRHNKVYDVTYRGSIETPRVQTSAAANAARFLLAVLIISEVMAVTVSRPMR